MMLQRSLPLQSGIGRCFLVALTALALSLSSMAQPFATGTRTVTFTDPSRANRPVSVNLYYPSDMNGANVPIAAGSQQFPVVVFGHGFLIPTSSYSWLADSLVRYGYVVAMPNTEAGISPSHEQFGRDLAFLCSTIKSEGTNAASFLFGRIWPKAAVAGHSMGGGSSFLAASYSSDIHALFNFAAAETNPSAISAAASVQIPSLIFSGSGDCIVSPSVQQNMYAPISGTCKSYLNIQGALHCQFANNNGTCAFGQITSGCNTPGIGTASLFQKIQSTLLPFLDYFIKDICIRGDVYLQSIQTIQGVSVLTTCSGFPTCGLVPVNLLSFQYSRQSNQLVFSWKATHETGLQEYILEKKISNTDWQSVSRVMPKQNGLPENNYSVLTEAPIEKQSWYRLRMRYSNGPITDSRWLRVPGAGNREIVTLFPNPSHEVPKLQIESNTAGTVQIQILDGTGKSLLKIPGSLTVGNNEIVLKGAEHVATGMYRILIWSNRGELSGQVNWIKY